MASIDATPNSATGNNMHIDQSCENAVSKKLLEREQLLESLIFKK